MRHLKLTLLAALLAAPLASRAADDNKLTIDTSGWFVLQSYFNSYSQGGGVNTMDLPRFAVAGPLSTADDKSALGAGVKQSRLRMAIGLPSDGILGNAKLKAFVEGDFNGGTSTAVSSKDSVLPRLRHAYVSANWKQLANLTVLVGQTEKVFAGERFATSIAHLAMPRFGGAGVLFRRAPMVKVTADVPVSDLTFGAQVAAIAASNAEGDKATAPNGEARVAAKYNLAGKPLVEVGVSTHYGREKFEVNTTTKELDTTNSQAFAVDLKLDVPYVTLVGYGFQGENIDTMGSIAGFTAVAAPTSTGVLVDTVNHKIYNMETQGAWAQAIVTPVKGLQLLVGYGFEEPKKKTLALPGGTVAANTILKSQQISGGAILNLTSRWRVGLEYTQYTTDVVPATAGAKDQFKASQVELATLLAL